MRSPWTLRAALPLLCAWFLYAPPSALGQAPEPIKPRFLLVVDTSGSMQENCTNGSTNAPSCNNCTNGCSVVNSCGLSRTRINDAKCALREMVAATTSAEFGVMQFRHPCRAACDSRAGGANGTCDADLSVAISATNASTLRWVDGVCQGSCTGGVTEEIYAYGYTPIAQSLVRAKEYFQGTLSGASAPSATDGFARCRTQAVILLTDGDESCNGNPVTAAGALRSTQIPAPGGAEVVDIKTYVIGFGLTPGYANIESLANAGGGDAPGQYKGYYAQNVGDIATALSAIITSLQVPTECPTPDAGTPEAGVPDAGSEAGVADAGPDGDTPDAGADDAAIDADAADGGLDDAGQLDAGAIEDAGGVDASGEDADVADAASFWDGGDDDAGVDGPTGPAEEEPPPDEEPSDEEPPEDEPDDDSPMGAMDAGLDQDSAADAGHSRGRSDGCALTSTQGSGARGEAVALLWVVALVVHRQRRRSRGLGA